ncbi:MAG: FHA domain-containing protein [Lachnospiraceae bacterium]
MTNYKQTCPECYYEVFLDKLENKLDVCPKCKGKKIARKIVKIKTEEKSIQCENLDKDEEEEQSIEKLKGQLGIDLPQDVSSSENKLLLKYKNGIIDTYFEIEIEKSSVPCVLGRSGIGKEFFKKDIRISNEHFSIFFENDIWKLVDKKSTNGTYVNGRLINPYTERDLVDGDIIKLGKTDTSTVLEVNINAVC